MIPFYVATFGRWVIVEGQDALSALHEAAEDVEAQEILQGQPPRVVRPATDCEVADWVGYWSRVRQEKELRKTIVLSEFFAKQIREARERDTREGCEVAG